MIVVEIITTAALLFGALIVSNYVLRNKGDRIMQSKVNSNQSLGSSSDPIPIGTSHYPNGLIQAIKVASGSWVKYEYDNLHRLCRSVTSSGCECVYQFNKDGYETFFSMKRENIHTWHSRLYNELNQVIRYSDSHGNFWTASMPPKIVNGRDVCDIKRVIPSSRLGVVPGATPNEVTLVKTEVNTCTDYSPASQRTKNLNALKDAEEKIKIILLNLEADTGLSVNFIDVKSLQEVGRQDAVESVHIQLELKLHTVK